MTTRSHPPRAGRLFWRCRTVSWWRSTMISRSFERPKRTAKRCDDTTNRYRTRHIGPQDASASCLVSAPDHILGPHRVFGLRADVESTLTDLKHQAHRRLRTPRGDDSDLSILTYQMLQLASAVDAHHKRIGATPKAPSPRRHRRGRALR